MRGTIADGPGTTIDHLGSGRIAWVVNSTGSQSTLLLARIRSENPTIDEVSEYVYQTAHKLGTQVELTGQQNQYQDPG